MGLFIIFIFHSLSLIRLCYWYNYVVLKYIFKVFLYLHLVIKVVERIIHWVTKKPSTYLTPYVCHERIFDGLHFSLNKLIFNKLCIYCIVYCPFRNASFGTFCVQIGQLLESHCTVVGKGYKTYFDFLTFFGSFGHADIENHRYFFYFWTIFDALNWVWKYWIHRVSDTRALLCSKIWHFCVLGVQSQLWTALCN